MSVATTTQLQGLHADILAWFDESARELPWRTDPQPWRVMVSEFMLQQTPVARVLPVFEAWMRSLALPRLAGLRKPR